ncbi:hypothetical protein Bca4012_062759 [Brassica carinata]
MVQVVTTYLITFNASFRSASRQCITYLISVVSARQIPATRSSHRQCLIFWIKESFHLILKKAFRLIDDELEKILGLSSHRYLVQMAVTDNTDAAIFVASDGSITKLINVCASDVVLVWFATRPRTW